MDIIKKIKTINLIAYLCFVINIIICMNPILMQKFELFSFVPLIIVFYSTAEFNFKADYRMKKVIYLSIPDFLVRCIAMLIGFYCSTLEYGSIQFKWLLGVEIILFLSNLFLEMKMEHTVQCMNLKPDRMELSVEDIILQENHGIVISQAVAFGETIILVVGMILGIGIPDKMAVGMTICYLGLIVAVMILYMVITWISMGRYYNHSKMGRSKYLKENVVVVLMVLLITWYSYMFRSESVSDFLVYMLFCCLLIPRTVGRRKRLEQVYEQYLSQKKI